MRVKIQTAFPVVALCRMLFFVVLMFSGFFAYIGLTQITENVFADATITVNTTADNVTASDGNCTLREAILNANADSDTTSGDCTAGDGADTIIFSVTGTITPASDLPTISTTVTIDGTTQGGADCSARTLLIEINGTNQTYGLQVTGDNFVLRGLAINRVSGQHGVRVINASNPTVECSNLGTDVTGTTTGIGNDEDGIGLENVTSGTIGSTTPANRNIISGNGQAGVELVDGTNGVDVIGNYIGTDFAGTTAIADSGPGVAIWGATGNTIGGTSSTERNIISGNNGNGVELDADNDPDPSTDNTIIGNYIGTTPTGTTALQNTVSGIYIGNSSDSNTIGGTTGVTPEGACTGSCNVISGNSALGVNIASSSSNTVAGNHIGVDRTGATALSNASSGVNISGVSTDNTIGGTSTEARNIISGNGADGVEIQNTGATDNIVSGNYIGTDTTGEIDRGNGSDGIAVADDASSNTIGGTTSGARNVISGNSVYGIRLADDSSSSTVHGNYVGTDADGATALPNTTAGIGLFNSSSSNIIGGTTSGARNVISGNTGHGIIATGTTASNTILGNYIGTDATGLADLGNGNLGIDYSSSATGNVVGGTASGSRNVISGNASSGLAIDGLGANLLVQGNYIGLNADGSGVIPNDGATTNANVAIQGDNNTIGGSTSAARNVISGTPSKTGIGVTGLTPFGGSNATGNKIQGNYIGTNTNGEIQDDFGNGDFGIVLAIDSTDNLVGGIGNGEGNVIAGNGAGVGVLTFTGGTPAINNSILGNSIHGNEGAFASSLGIDLFQTADFTNFTNNGVTENDDGDADFGGTNTGSNHYLNSPEISSVSSDDGQATITYDLDINDTETGATGYRIEFFANDSADASGHGEGQTYLGSDEVSGDVSARQATITLPNGVSGDKFITATTTMTDASNDGFGHTSEFAAVEDVELVATDDTDSSDDSSVLADTLADTGSNEKLVVAIGLVCICVGVLLLRKQIRLRMSSSPSR